MIYLYINLNKTVENEDLWQVYTQHDVWRYDVFYHIKNGYSMHLY